MIPIFGIASVEGFPHALPGWHPRELMPSCESVLVFGHPLFPRPLYTEERTYITNQSWFDANKIVDRQIATWKGELFALLDDWRGGVACFGKFRPTAFPTFSYRLAQVAAGMAVYGRAGACIHPDYGCYYRVGVLLTESNLTPGNGDRLDGFGPCQGRSEGAKICPIKAIDAGLEPGAGYDGERCMRFVMKTSERRGNARICGQCFSVCPWSMGRVSPERPNAKTEEVRRERRS